MQNIEEKYRKQRLELTRAIFDLLPLHNWDEALLSEAEKKCGFEESYHYVLFSEGLSAIVDFFEDWQDELALQAISTEAVPEKIREKIALFLRQRVRQIPPIVHTKTAAYFAMPDKLLQGNKIAWRTCDKIWRFAGDNSTDYNHHTKRALLMSVYLSGILFYIADRSEGQKETDEYIIKSLETIVNFANMARNFKMPEMADLPIFRMFS